MMRHPHPAALVRKMRDGSLFAALRQLEDRGLVTRRRGLYRLIDSRDAASTSCGWQELWRGSSRERTYPICGRGTPVVWSSVRQCPPSATVGKGIRNDL